MSGARGNGERLLLAVDASAAGPGVALVGPGVCDARTAGDREGSEALLEGAAALLHVHGRALGDLEGLVLAAGPGSFTGLRVAVAVVQALAFARSLPVLPVSTLAVAAARAAREAAVPVGGEVWVLRDARMGDGYLGRYRVVDGAVDPPGVEPLTEDAMVRLDAPALAVPPGALRTGDLDHAPVLGPAPLRNSGPARCDPLGVAVLGSRAFRPERTLAAAAVRPVYLRDRLPYRKATGRERP